MKRILMLPMLILCIMVVPLVSYAKEVEENPQPNIGVSTICPEQTIETRGTKRPSNVWNIGSKGIYHFGGSANRVTIYTNFKFKGKTSYTVYVKNTGNYPITVKAKRLTKTYASTKISAGKEGSFKFSNIQKDTEFYLVFDGSEFNGYIK